MKSPTIKDFKKARIEFDHSVQEVADKLGYSRTYIYECLKYPNKNKGLHKRIVDYIRSSEKLQNQQ